MARRMVGATPRDRKVVVRLNTEESEELETKRAARGHDVSTYFRTLMKEDDHAER